MAGSLLEKMSAQVTLDPETSRTLRFGDAALELRAGLSSSMLVDLSRLGRIHATGADILDLLNRLSTADLRVLAPGEGRPTVLTTSKGRIVDRLFVHQLGKMGVLLITGAGAGERVRAHIDRFTFGEATGLADMSGSFCHLGLLGPASRELAASAGIPLPASFGSARYELDGHTILVLGEDGFGATGLSLLFAASEEDAVGARLVPALLDRGATLAGDLALEAWRILRGYPVSGRELTEEHNPLEAGLEEAVSFTKGCYVGQEVVARLRTYDKVSRVLVGLLLPVGAAVPAPGTEVRSGNREAGVVRSAVVPPGHKAPVALAYVRKEAVSSDSVVELGRESGNTAVVVSLPFGSTP